MPATRDVLSDSYLFKNVLASCIVRKHAHSRTDSSCIVTTTCKYRTNTPDNNSFEGLHSVFVCNIQEISASGTPLNTNRIKYNFVCVCFDFCASLKRKIIIYNTYPVDCANLTFLYSINASSSTVTDCISVL